MNWGQKCRNATLLGAGKEFVFFLLALIPGLVCVTVDLPWGVFHAVF